MVIAELLASLGVTVDPKAQKTIESTLGGIAKNASRILGGVAAIFGGAQITGFVNELITVASELKDVAFRLDMSATSVQRWRYVAGQAGVSADGLSNALKFTTKNA